VIIEQLQTITKNFLQELTDADSGKKTSLAFLRNFVPTPFVADDEVFQVLVVGGSICRNVLMKRNGKESASDRSRRDGFTVLSHSEKEQPIFHTKEDFLAFLSLEIDKTVTHIALNFAFPLQPTVRDEKLDGVLLYGTKEHTFEGLQGNHVGQMLEEYIKEQEHRVIQVCVANDTICLLLSGLTQASWDNLACAIVGTGYNAAFFLSESEAVNLEGGGFANVPQDPTDKKIDETSTQPGMQLFEKQVSGGYLYRVFNVLLEEKGITYPEVTSTKTLDELARGRNDVGMYAQQVLEKSAQLAATQIVGIAQYLKRDLTFVMEGSLFWKGFNYKETVEKTVKELTTYKITFIHIENSSVMGAAKLIA